MVKCFTYFILMTLAILGCAHEQPAKNKDFLSYSLENPLHLESVTTTSRYWTYDKHLVHFISNVTEENKNLPPIIYVHGLGGRVEDFSELIKAINRPYYAIDLPPFGKSLTKNTELSIRRYSALLQEFISMTAAKKVNLVCHSMGGQICIDLALTNPEQIQLLTLIDPAGVYQRSAYINQTLKHHLGVNIGPTDHPATLSIGDLSWYNQDFTRKMVTSNPLVLLAIESYRNNFHSRINQIKVKTLILWGRDDVIFNFENGLFLKENIENSVLYIIEKADHFPLKSHAAFISNIIKKNL